MANRSFERRGDATASDEDVARNARNELAAYVVRAAPMRDFDPLLRRAVRRALPASMRTRLRLVATDLVAPRERRRAARAARRRPLRLHLGSAETFKPGWVNVDLVAATGQVDVAWNLLRPLPFPDASVEAIFHEHVLEHFPLAKGAALLAECHRVLTPGGVLRVGVPDAGAYGRAYAEGDDTFFESVRPGRPTPLLAMQEIYFRHGHQAAYDYETLSLVLKASDFAIVERRDFGDSRIRPSPDSEHRRLETLYVEAVK